MTTPKVIPLIIQKLLNSEENSEGTTQDCEECGGIGTVTLVEDHIYYNEAEGLEVEVPAFVCDTCSNEFYPSDSYLEIIRKLEVLKGKSYIKVDIKDGKIIKYAIH